MDRGAGTARWRAALAGFLLLAVGLGACLAAPRARADESADLLRVARTRIEAAKKSLGPRGLNDVMLFRLDEARVAVEALAPPPKPELLPVDPESGEAEQEQVVEENKRRLERWARACDAWRKREERIRSRWVDVLGDALVLEEILRQSERNIREDVNRRALELLVATEREDAAVVVARALTGPYLEMPSFRASPGMPGLLLVALGRLRSLEALETLRELLSRPDRLGRLDVVEHGGAVPPGPAPWAGDPHPRLLRVIASYENVPGRLRRLLVRDLVAVYAAREAEALQPGRPASHWEGIREAAIDATWVHAGRPTHDTGQRLATMHELEAWFGAHRSRRDPAWRD